jgi:hypothetical protein
VVLLGLSRPLLLQTAMVATLSVETMHLDESISTARFAQRVARIQNTLSVNEDVDPKAIIRQLKARVRVRPLQRCSSPS